MKKALLLLLNICFFVIISLGTSVVLHAENVELRNILIVTSYNPDVKSTANNISALVGGLNDGNVKLDISIESMNVQNLSEIHQWKGRMYNILKKFENTPPSLTIFLGQEAWAAYLSQDDDFIKKMPVLGGMVSLNTVLLPNDSVKNIDEWYPNSLNVMVHKPDFNIIGGFFYYYDVEKNLNLIRTINPNSKKIYFVSDNTFGGVLMQARVRDVVKEKGFTNVDYIDGRKLSFLDVNEMIRNMSRDNNLLIGTWRIDMTENYVLNNTSSILYSANPGLHSFSMSSSALGEWAIGGYVPNYRLIGKDIADLSLDYLNGKIKGKRIFHIISNRYSFDKIKLEYFDIDDKLLPEKKVFLNIEPSFFVKYKNLCYILFVVFLLLITIIVVAFYYIIKINKLKHHLELNAVELKEAKDAAEESNRLKSAFLANVSHEIRTPLNAIVGFSDVLSKMDNIEKEEKEQYSAIISNNSSLLLNLINDILDVSRLESGKMKFVMESADIVDVCKKAFSTVRCAFVSDVKFEFKSNMEKFMMIIDAQRFEQIIINLLTNAMKFTRKGEILLNLNIEEEKQITLYVQDTGCGVPKDKADAIFDRFEKLNEYSQGTGLGLSICKLIVEYFDGKIWLDTDYTDGARFVLTIPVK